ncbi:MAG: 4'-phosphopantetheinyl transferase superfamily protein [Flavobacteriales bacterium]|nr:4'-phosphopantetheinyl transferase superfamily protein [Flavobacteriales bacterium]MBT6013360.1 4'-phosphopantetheinyl transferase superfamily protein [Flavobacteriales bacterium]MBT7481544.1 4'-phosphopantetheinyl transferase superfamily protein [Flavobacteriales bacterium]
MEEIWGKLQNMISETDSSHLTTEKRKKEFLSTRILLNKLNPNSEITYNKFGAPQLSDGKQISISHSKTSVAIIISDNNVGIDIEEIDEKALRISSKFINKNHLVNLTKEKATLIWCVKECIYKLFQKGNIDFRKDITIEEFQIEKKGKINCKLRGEKIIVNYQKIDNQYLAYVCN